MLSAWPKKLVVLFNKFFQTVKKRPLVVVNFKRGSEDYLKSSLCYTFHPQLMHRCYPRDIVKLIEGAVKLAISQMLF